MKEVYRIIREQWQHLDTIIRLTKYDKKSAHQSHYLGLFWEFLSPAIQIAIYYIVFGLRLHGKTMLDSDVPYIYWMLMGVIPWFYISSSIVTGANAIYSNLGSIMKTNFPISTLPSISIIKGLTSYFSMLSIFLGCFILQGYYPTWQWLQFFYYFIAMIVLLFAFSLLNSAISVVFRDYQLIISSMMRLLFFISGAVIDISEKPHSLITELLRLNPFVYLIEGFRDAFLNRGWFWQDPWWLLYFWGVTGLILFIGAQVHKAYKNYFIEYM